MFQKDGGCCSTAQATGLKPCYFSVGRRKQSAISKDNSKPGLTPDGILYAGYRLDKKKAISKAGGWRYPSIKGHARPMFNLLIIR